MRCTNNGCPEYEDDECSHGAFFCQSRTLGNKQTTKENGMSDQERDQIKDDLNVAEGEIKKLTQEIENERRINSQLSARMEDVEYQYTELSEEIVARHNEIDEYKQTRIYLKPKKAWFPGLRWIMEEELKQTKERLKQCEGGNESLTRDNNRLKVTIKQQSTQLDHYRKRLTKIESAVHGEL